MSDSERGPDRFVQRGRMGRFLRLSGTAAQVGGAMLGRAVSRPFRDSEGQAAARRTGLVTDARRVARAMGELKGATMKLGQMLSVAPDLLPREIADELAKLQTHSPPMDEATVAAQIRSGLGMGIDEAFTSFDPHPLGAASIGQVHHAVTRDGREVAVKIQYPGVADTLDADIDNLWSLMKLGRFLTDETKLRAVVEELRGGLVDELDYAAEADNLRSYGARLAARPGVVTPEVVEELSCSTVLTMTHLPGRKLDVALQTLPANERDAWVSGWPSCSSGCSMKRVFFTPIPIPETSCSFPVKASGCWTSAACARGRRPFGMVGSRPSWLSGRDEATSCATSAIGSASRRTVARAGSMPSSSRRWRASSERPF